jgi:hypothetical protein
VVRLPPLAPRRPHVPPAVLAARTLSLATLGPRRRAERRAESVRALEALAGASLLELRQKLPTRYWLLGLLSLTGKSVREIADLVGYSGPSPVLKALRHPAVVRLVEEVRAAQLEAITRLRRTRMRGGRMKAPQPRSGASSTSFRGYVKASLRDAGREAWAWARDG